MKTRTPLIELPKYYQVLENWRPRPSLKFRKFESSRIELEKQFVNIIHQYGLRCYQPVRDPYFHDRVYIRDDMEWHRDRDKYTFSDLNGYIVFWTNIYPTLFRKNWSPFKVKVRKGDLVLINNLTMLHKAPKEVRMTYIRWFARTVVELKKGE